MSKYYVKSTRVYESWFNDAKFSILHRVFGPSTEWANGKRYWFCHNKLHKEDGPAITMLGGRSFYYLNDIRCTDSLYHQLSRETRSTWGIHPDETE